MSEMFWQDQFRWFDPKESEEKIESAAHTAYLFAKEKKRSKKLAVLAGVGGLSLSAALGLNLADVHTAYIDPAKMPAGVEASLIFGSFLLGSIHLLRSRRMEECENLAIDNLGNRLDEAEEYSLAAPGI